MKTISLDVVAGKARCLFLVVCFSLFVLRRRHCHPSSSFFIKSLDSSGHLFLRPLPSGNRFKLPEVFHEEKTR